MTMTRAYESESMLPPLPTTQPMADLERILKLGGPNIDEDFDLRGLGWLFNAKQCPDRMLEAMLWFFEVSPFYWEGNPESITRSIYDSLYMENCGLLYHLGGECAMLTFANVTQTSYHYSWRRNAAGKKLGITLYIANPSESAIDYANTPGGQDWLRRAYAFMIPGRITIDDIIFEETFNLPIGVHADVFVEGFTP